MGQREDTEEERANWHWRNSMRPVRFFNLDARAAFPFAILLFYFRPISLLFAIVTTIIFVVLERKGLTFDASLRAFRNWFLGRKRPGWISYRRRRFRDFG